MDNKQFLTRIRRLHNLQAASVTFAKTGITALFRLRALMNHNHRVYLATHQEVVMAAVMSSNDWGRDQNRTFTIFGLPTAEDEWLGAIARDIDRVEPGDHGAKMLMSSRTVVQRDAYEAIARRVATPYFFGEMQSWDVTLEHSLAFQEGFPMVQFQLIYQGEVIGSCGIDGFSGRVIANGSFTDELYQTPEQLQRFMRAHVERIMEKLTAA